MAPAARPSNRAGTAGLAHASDVRRLGREELQRLLHGRAAEQDLLGLLAAARGGLSARDLAELAAVPLWEVEDVLHTVARRTFTRRPSNWAPGTHPDVYLLGHEELQAAAADYLGGPRLKGYLDRLHAWADGYRPADGPRAPRSTCSAALSGSWKLSGTCPA